MQPFSLCTVRVVAFIFPAQRSSLIKYTPVLVGVTGTVIDGLGMADFCHTMVF